MTAPTDIAALSFEDALTQLEGIVRDLESGQAPLEESINAYERGVALRRHCETKLKEAELKIEKITPGDGGGQPGTAPFDAD